MSVEDYGKDVAGVQALQRKQEELERDMTALHTQLVVSGGHRVNYSLYTSLKKRGWQAINPAYHYHHHKK